MPFSAGAACFVITRIEIDGFKTFDGFSLDLRPFTAVVGPNASGKSNLFDAIKFVSRLAQTDIREAMLELRGRPEESRRQVLQPKTATFLPTGRGAARGAHTGIDTFQQGRQWFAAFCARLDIRAQSL